jgi:hypothetical protein
MSLEYNRVEYKNLLVMALFEVEECCTYQYRWKGGKEVNDAIDGILFAVDGGWRGGKDADGNCASEESQHPSSDPGCFALTGKEQYL